MAHAVANRMSAGSKVHGNAQNRAVFILSLERTDRRVASHGDRIATSEYIALRQTLQLS